MKIKCWSCSQPIEYSKEMIGMSIDCPDCKALVILPGESALASATLPKPPIIAKSGNFARPTFSIVILTLISFALIFLGFATSQILLVGGFVMLAIVALIDAVASSCGQIWQRISKD